MTIVPNSIQVSPFLRVQRQFPTDTTQALTVEINKAYVDIAQRVNERIVGIFASKASTVTGEQWYLQGGSAKQQSIRQVYPITGAGSYPHGINFASITNIVKIYGTFTDGTNWYPLPYVDTTSATDQISLSVTPTNLVVTAGGGAPAITKGTVILEWLSQV
jgi:hypothetical protein